MDINLVKENRLIKKSWQFSSNKFKSIIDNIWEQTPNSFDLFKKNNNELNKNIINLKNKEKRFREIGCLELADSLGDLVRTLCFESHHDHRKISIYCAACILAKINRISKNNFKPTLYPYHECVSFAPKNVINTIVELENLGNFIFDHYLVFTPSSDLEEGLNILLDKSLKSIVLGDKDGDCYFICHWQRL